MNYDLDRLDQLDRLRYEHGGSYEREYESAVIESAPAMIRALRAAQDRKNACKYDEYDCNRCAVLAAEHAAMREALEEIERMDTWHDSYSKASKGPYANVARRALAGIKGEKA